MLQTPTTITRDERPEQMRARAERNGYKNGTKFNSLESQVKYDSRFTGLLPTPTFMEGIKWANQYNPDSQMGQSLSAMAGSGMLPTPTARDYKNPSSPDGERIERKIREGYTIELNDLAPMGILPTPSARDWKGKTTPGVKKQGGQVYGEMLPDTIGRMMEASCPETAGGSFRLSPLFTEEMMGFPFLWTALPFLQYLDRQLTEKETHKSTPSQSGETNL